LPIVRKQVRSRFRKKMRNMKKQSGSQAERIKYVMGLVLSPLFELALVLVRLDHVASGIVNANHGVM
jgi:hypothetical protein